MSKIAAFFDIDGTVVRESILVKHFKRLVKLGIIDEKYWINEIRDKYEAYEKRHGNFDDYLVELGEVYRERMIGLHQSLIEFTASQVINADSEMVYRYTRDRIKWHQEQGHDVYFISGSPDFLVKRLAETYKITGYRGSVYEFKEEHFTGHVIPMWDSKSKQKALNELKEERALDFLECYAYGDTNGDFNMLKQMGHPTAINPSMKLLNMIRQDDILKDKCDIVIERKDVIYKVKSDVETIE